MIAIIVLESNLEVEENNGHLGHVPPAVSLDVMLNGNLDINGIWAKFGVWMLTKLLMIFCGKFVMMMVVLRILIDKNFKKYYV